MQKFSINQEKEIREYYESNGYVVIKGLLPVSKIDSFLSEYRKIKANPFFVYYSQSIHKCIRTSLTPEGFIKESMENATRLNFFPKFSLTMKNCLFHEGISKVLHSISGKNKYAMWQNMFFDFSPGTIEHQDHWYLDTSPAGNMIAAWYALEDIHPDAGCFFVLPQSHHGEVLTREKCKSHEDFRMSCVDLIDKNNYPYKSFPLSQGDVLFWHPFTMHGAYSNLNPKYSRKSLTAHFYPIDFDFCPMGFDKLKHEEQKFKATSNPQLFEVNKGSDTVWSLKNYIKYFRDRLSGNKKPRMDMRREVYTRQRR